MSDPRQPETAAWIWAMKAAEQLRGGTDAAYAPPLPGWNRPSPTPNGPPASRMGPRPALPGLATSTTDPAHG